ncbi:hypothetical protein C0581_04795 [Candidatus Parcubacteria bacterium]|nr:MAG: hypothetical protein C0581_04795 [Candidatus Parcubacteria bacterium]
MDGSEDARRAAAADSMKKSTKETYDKIEKAIGSLKDLYLFGKVDKDLDDLSQIEDEGMKDFVLNNKHACLEYLQNLEYLAEHLEDDFEYEGCSSESFEVFRALVDEKKAQIDECISFGEGAKCSTCLEAIPGFIGHGSYGYAFEFKHDGESRVLKMHYRVAEMGPYMFPMYNSDDNGLETSVLESMADSTGSICAMKRAEDIEGVVKMHAFSVSDQAIVMDMARGESADRVAKTQGEAPLRNIIKGLIGIILETYKKGVCPDRGLDNTFYSSDGIEVIDVHIAEDFLEYQDDPKSFAYNEIAGLCFSIRNYRKKTGEADMDLRDPKEELLDIIKEYYPDLHPEINAVIDSVYNV